MLLLGKYKGYYNKLQQVASSKLLTCFLPFCRQSIIDVGLVK